MDPGYKRLLAGLSPLAPIETGLPESGAPAGPVKAVMFDVYGTMFVSAAGDISQADTKKNMDEVVAEIFDDLEISGIPPEGIYESLTQKIKQHHDTQKRAGVEFPEIEIDRLWQEILKTESVRLARQAALAFEIRTNPVYPMPGLTKLIETLKKKGVAAGIISNAQFYTPLLFEHFTGSLPENSWARPDLLFYSYRYGHAKPSPLLFDMAADALWKAGIKEHETIFVGNDMLNDIYPAHNRGFQTALFAGDARSLRLHEDDPRCKNLSPEMVITGLGRIADIL